MFRLLSEQQKIELFFEPGNFIEGLKYLGLGMLGIFIVVAMIAGVEVFFFILATPRGYQDLISQTRD